MSELETRTAEQLPPLVTVDDETLFPGQNPAGPMGSLPMSVVAARARRYKRADSAQDRDLGDVGRQRLNVFDFINPVHHNAIVARTSTHDCTEDFNAARHASWLEGSGPDDLHGSIPVDIPAGNFIASGPIDHQEVVAGVPQPSFEGVAFRGMDVTATRILFAPPAIDTPLFRMRGGSGSHTNKAISGLTIEPVDVTYRGKGIGLLLKGQDYAVCEDFIISYLDTAIQLENAVVGEFTEFNELYPTRLFNNKYGYRFKNTGGNESFHGNIVSGMVNIPDGGFGLHMDGGGTNLTGDNNCFLYNAEIWLRLFGGVGAHHAVYARHATTINNIGAIRGEGNLLFEVDAPAYFHLRGRLGGIASYTFDAAPGALMFDAVRTGSTFSNAGLSGLSPKPLSPDLIGENPNGDFPVVFRQSGAGAENVAIASYRGASGWVDVGDVGFGEELEDFRPGLRIFADGSAVRSQTGALQIKDSANTSNQLLLSNGRTGGNIGRAPSFAVTANAGVGQALTTITTAITDVASSVFVRIFGSGFEYRAVLEFNHQGFGGAGVATAPRLLYQLAVAGVTITGFTVNASGALVATLTTDRALTIQCRELGLGYQLTS